MKISRGARTGIVLAGAAMALAACGQPQAGSAVTWDGGSIPESQVTEEAAQLASERGESVNQAITLVTINRLAQVQLADVAAEAAGVTVTQGEVDKARQELEDKYGGPEGVAQQSLQSGIPIGGLEGILRANRQVAGIMEKIGAPKDNPEQANQAVNQYLGLVSRDTNFTANPRFGTWSPAEIAVVPDPNALSRPADNAETPDLLSGLQQQ